MFAISPVHDVTWIDRRPRNAAQLELAGWHFLPQRRRWDASERELLSTATGLAAYSPTAGEHASQEWWLAFLRAWIGHRDPVLAVRDAQGRVVV